MSRRVMFYIQSLLGIGHLKRSSMIARAMVQAGLDVTVVLGGEPVPGIDFAACARILLPPARALHADFRTLVDEQGRPIDNDWRDRRIARLLSEFEAICPQVLLIELFPFGRRQFRFELLPLIEAARAMPSRPRIVSSVRDVLVRKRDQNRNRAVLKLVQTYIDAVLVHGDPHLIPLEASFPDAPSISDKISYTGYVIEPRAVDAEAGEREDGRGEVVVSAGGGAVGEPLFRLALAARPLTRVADRPWRLVTGPHLPDAVFQDLSWNRPEGVIVERWRDDLAVLLRNCALSISQAGYNTVMDLLAARARAVVVPFADEGETEQTLRAQVLAQHGVLTLVEAKRASPEVIAAAIDEALTKRPPSLPLNTRGAEGAARLIAKMCDRAGP